MRALKLMPVLAALLVVAGCIPVSVYPYFTPGTEVSDAHLTGIWIERDGNGKVAAVWKFFKAPEQAYRLVYSEGNHAVVVFDAHLFKLGVMSFLDLIPSQESGESSSGCSRSGGAVGKVNMLGALHWVPVHSVWRVRIANDQLQFSMLNRDWLIDQLESKSVDFPFAMEGGPAGEITILDSRRLVLTASTEQLQAFLMKWGDDPKAFPDWTVLKRKK